MTKRVTKQEKRGDMDDEYRRELAALIEKYSSNDGLNETPVPGVVCYRETGTERLTPTVYAPSLCVVAQGRKQVMLDREIHHYGPSEYLIVSVDLPLIGKVTEASPDQPYLCLKIDIDLQQLSELVISTERAFNGSARGLFVGKLDEQTSESILRLARLMDAPDDIPVLAPMMMREVYYRMLRSSYGGTIAQTALKGSNLQRIASVIQKIRSSFNQPIRVKELAELAGMSASSFHAHFKSVTAMSPLQFQKHLRLVEARRIMLSGRADAANTAYRVGYESPSQFSREYARMFGNPPARDIGILRRHEPVAPRSAITADQPPPSAG